MVVFGGGNEGIVDELHVYNTGKINFVRVFTYFFFCTRTFYPKAKDVVEEKRKIFGIKLSLKTITLLFKNTFMTHRTDV